MNFTSSRERKTYHASLPKSGSEGKNTFLVMLYEYRLLTLTCKYMDHL